MLSRLGHAEQAQVIGQVARYLVLRQTFRDCLRACVQTVRVACPRVSDAIARRAVRAWLDEMRIDRFYALEYRPALLRAAAGDWELALRLQLDVEELHRVVEHQRPALREALRRVQHPLHAIGPDHAERVEHQVITRTRPHASKFAYRRARFLGMGESGREHADAVHDVQIMGLRGFRWYYPFRSGILMDNTVRTTITNRGLSYVKHQTRQCRGRMVTDEYGVTTNVETQDEVAVARFTWRDHEERDAALRIDVERLARRTDVIGAVVRVVTNPITMEAIVDDLARSSPRVMARATQADVVEALRLSETDLASATARYVGYTPSVVSAALRSLRGLFAA